MNPIRLTFSIGCFPELPPPIFTVVFWGTFYLFLYFLILFCAHINLQLGVFYFGKFLASTPPDFPWFRCLSCPSYRSCNCFYFRSNDLLIFLKKQGCGAMRAFSKPVQLQQFNVEFPQIHEDPSWFSLTHRGQPVQHWFGFCTDCQGSVMCLLCYSSRSFVWLVSFCTTGDISVDGLSVDPTSSSLQELRFMKKLQILQVILKVLCLTDRPASFGGTGWVSSALHLQSKAQRKWKPMCMWHSTSWQRRLWQKTRWGWPGPTGLDNRKLMKTLTRTIQ